MTVDVSNLLKLALRQMLARRLANCFVVFLKLNWNCYLIYVLAPMTFTYINLFEQFYKQEYFSLKKIVGKDCINATSIL
jgi:hypothetical protein